MSKWAAVHHDDCSPKPDQGAIVRSHKHKPRLGWYSRGSAPVKNLSAFPTLLSPPQPIATQVRFSNPNYRYSLKGVIVGFFRSKPRARSVAIDHKHFQTFGLVGNGSQGAGEN